MRLPQADYRLSLQFVNPVRASQQSGQMPACGKPDGTDFIGINAKLFGIGPQSGPRPCNLEWQRERSFSTKTMEIVAAVTAGSQSWAIFA